MNFINLFKKSLLVLLFCLLVFSINVNTVIGQDDDGDGIPDIQDNCPGASNPNQEDTYPPGRNGIGDACDCESDFTCDGDVDADDVTAFLADFGREQYYQPCTNEDPCNGDFDCDVDVDADDVTKLLEDFGREVYYNPCPACEVGNWCFYCTDADDDGFNVEGGVCGPVDCDDEDGSINPGGTDVCDVSDQNCDGEILPCILEDGDGDLWAESQGDCDDTDPAIFPGATDFPGDVIDQDCDGEDDPVPSLEDFDNDGYSYASGYDCNDRMPTVYDGAPEILGALAAHAGDAAPGLVVHEGRVHGLHLGAGLCSGLGKPPHHPVRVAVPAGAPAEDHDLSGHGFIHCLLVVSDDSSTCSSSTVTRLPPACLLRYMSSSARLMTDCGESPVRAAAADGSERPAFRARNGQ